MLIICYNKHIYERVLIMKTIADFLNEKILIDNDTYAYFTLEDDKVFINYKDMKIQYKMLFNPKYYTELLLGAEQLVRYYSMMSTIKGDNNGPY